MLKNKKLAILMVVLTLAVIIVIIYVVWLVFLKSSAEQSASTNSTGTITLNAQYPNSDLISLEPKPAEQKDPNSLTVNDTQSNSANLGSGSRQQISANSSSSAGKDNFGQYEQYKDKQEVFFGEIIVGTGAEATKDKQLAVVYKGYLTNGQVFDQSRTSNNGQLQPLMFTLGAGQLIPGFELGVAGMKVGGTRRVIIPPSLGYGDKAQGSIPANSVLVFDIQLTAVQ